MGSFIYFAPIDEEQADREIGQQGRNWKVVIRRYAHITGMRGGPYQSLKAFALRGLRMSSTYEMKLLENWFFFF